MSVIQYEYVNSEEKQTFYIILYCQFYLFVTLSALRVNHAKTKSASK